MKTKKSTPPKTPEPKETSAQATAREAKAFRTVRREAFNEENRREREARAAEPRANPLINLPEKDRAKLFVWLRECPYDDAVSEMLKNQGIPEVTPAELSRFFEEEAESHWQRRIERAALEANALVRLVEANPTNFSSGILAALGQEAFRQIASGEVDPDAMGKMANLFLKARGDERAGQALELRREKMRRDWRNQTEQALEIFATEVEQHPAARKAFELMRTELLQNGEAS